MDFIFRVAGSMCFGICLLGLNFVYLVSMGTLRNLPTIISFVRKGVREILSLTYRLYRPILKYIQPYVEHYLGLDIANVYVRSAATVILSLIILALLWLITGWGFSPFGIAFAVIHGLAVGIIWDEVGQPEGLQIGEEIP